MKLLATFALAAALAFTAAPASAQTAPPDEARLAAAKEVIDASGGRTEAFKSMSSIKAAMVAQLRNQDPAKADRAQKALDEFLVESNPKVAAYLDEMQGVAISFYANTFTTEELKTISAFQSSPAAVKFRAVVPELSGAMTAPMFRFQSELMKELGKP